MTARGTALQARGATRRSSCWSGPPCRLAAKGEALTGVPGPLGVEATPACDEAVQGEPRACCRRQRAVHRRAWGRQASLAARRTPLDA
jgi:hypothetical protein